MKQITNDPVMLHLMLKNARYISPKSRPKMKDIYYKLIIVALMCIAGYLIYIATL